MTGKNSSNGSTTPLTEKGVLTLFKQEFKKSVTVQVIFLAWSEKNCYLRLSDGKSVSPIIFLLTKLHMPQLCVGAIISVTEVDLVACSDLGDENALEDVGLHHLYIQKYSVVESRDSVGRVLGLTGTHSTYRDAILHIWSALEKFDENIASDILWDSKQIKELQEARDLNRERGNYFYKQSDYEQAIAFYDMAIKKDPYDSRVWANCSLAHYQVGEFAAAEKHALIAIKMDPFNEKAYYRAGNAADQQSKEQAKTAYACDGIFICSSNKDLQGLLKASELTSLDSNTTFVKVSAQLLSNNGKLPCTINDKDKYSQMIGDSVVAQLSAFINGRHVGDINNLCEDDDYSPRGDFKRSKEKRGNTGKLIKKVQEENKKKEEEKIKKKKEEEKQRQEEEKRKEQEEEKKRQQEMKRDTEGTVKLRINLTDTLNEGKRLYESDQVHQAIDMFTKCLNQYSPDGNGHSNKGERHEVLILQFILAMCQVRGGRSSVMDGVELLKALCEDTCKFNHKPAAHCLLASTFQNINLYKLSHHHAKICCSLLKQPKQAKVVRWPNSSKSASEPISSTKPEILEEICKELLNRPSTSRPTPEATCRFKDCLPTQDHPYAKEEMFKTDPDFRGYVSVLCEENCIICYHPGCWKAYKDIQEDPSGRKPDKDFLGLRCMTPDCSGLISSIRIYDESGELKNEQAKDKKDKKLATQSTKMRKKKDKKKEKASVLKGNDKKKTQTECIPEESHTPDEISPVFEVVTPINNPTQPKHKQQQQQQQQAASAAAAAAAAPLPIDPESLDSGQVTVLKPTSSTPGDADLAKTPKKNRKKNKKAKTTANLELYGDPLAASLNEQNEYVARLRALKQQKEALEGHDHQRLSPTSPLQSSALQLDPTNPFYLPQHLRDNPGELEKLLQKNILVSNTGLKREIIDTLLEFMYEWLKSEGPMSIHDKRLREQVSENFPPEAQTYVTQCGGMRGFLMQSLKFAMIDDTICAGSDVMRAQESMCQDIKSRMNAARYLTKFSDGRRAKKFTHLLDDNKSTCSSTSSASASHQAGSHLSSSITSKNTSESARSSSVPSVSKNLSDSTQHPSQAPSIAAAPVLVSTPVPPLVSTPVPVPHSITAEVQIDEITEAIMRSPLVKTPSSKAIDRLDSFELSPSLNPAAPEFAPRHSISESDVQVNGLDADEDGNHSNDEDCEFEYDEDDDNNDENDNENDDGDDDEDEEEDCDDEEDLFQSDEEGVEVVYELRQEKAELEERLVVLEDEKQQLADKLCQARSQSKSEVGSLKQKLEETQQELKEATSEKQNLVMLRENDVRKMRSDVGRLQEEARTIQARCQVLQQKCDLSNDRINELRAKLAEEEEVSQQLREETRNLQESLTSSSRRAHEAEVKYLCIKKDLVEESLNRTVDRLTEESSRMKQLLPSASGHTLPDYATLTRTILAWEQTIKDLLVKKKTFTDDGVKLLGMVNQGRPLNALPPGDLQVPAIPKISVAPLLCLMQNPDKQVRQVERNSHIAHVPQQKPTPPAPHNQPPPQLKSQPPPPIPLPQGGKDPQLSGIPLMFQAPPPPLGQGYGVPRPITPHQTTTTTPTATTSTTTTLPTPATTLTNGTVPKTVQQQQQQQQQQAAKTTDGANSAQFPDSHQLFVGQLPWGYNENDLKKLFTVNFGEVVSATVFDQGRNADGRVVPKYGFVTFRNAADCAKVLASRPVVVDNHALNIQPKENKKFSKPASGVGAMIGAVGGVRGGGGVEVGGGSGGGGISGSDSSAYGLSDISLDTEVSGLSAKAGQLPTPPPSQTTPGAGTPSGTATKPNFKNLTSSTSVGAIGTLPPKLVRPQAKHAQPPAKLGALSSAALKEDHITNAPSYKRLIDMSKQRLGKEYSSPEICSALREVRSLNNNSLSGMSTDKIVERVRTTLRSRRPGAGPATVAPWAGLAQQGAGSNTGPDWQGPKKENGAKEETCSICLEPLAASPTVPLQCQHVFHEHCIKDWLKRQSNCPNCRTFALMTDEYPTLPQA